MPPASRLLYDWVDLALGGTLDDELRRMKAEGLTIDQIVDELRDRDQIVSRETVRRWLLSREAEA